MSEETITVADVSDGPGGASETKAGTPVELPVVEILTGRGFITGKSGSGKSNTASVVIEKLLDGNFPVMIVDTDGEYYGLKEEYEILHAGADEECDIQVNPEHAEKLASLALEQNVPIILDVSGYLDEDEASKLVLQTARQLFAKEKKLKKPFLMLVEECHEYIPEGGGLDETGKMLIKIGKRGRKHGLGIVGISQRPADVKKDYITQCDWLCWHRLTWNNDTKVVGRILGDEYADAIEDMNDGEAFLVTDWSESIRRVQFHRKQTFDAGATPGLEDFERPELKSVSGDLVSELQDISDEKKQRESEIADLRQELDKKKQRITELEQELEEARDLKRMADKFAQAMLQKAEAPYRGGQGRNLTRETDQADLREYERELRESTDDVEAKRMNSEAEDGAPETDRMDPDERTETETRGLPDSDDIAEPSDAAAIDFATEHLEFGTRQAVIDELTERVDSLDALETGMLQYYRDAGVSDPLDAHVAAGGDGDRTLAYSRNRALRETGLVRHAGRGKYAYAIPDLIREAYADRLDRQAFEATLREVESAFVDHADSESEETESESVSVDTETHQPRVQD